MSAGSGVEAHWVRAYVGLPGPANRYEASRTRATAMAWVSGSAVAARRLATPIGVPTLVAK